MASESAQEGQQAASPTGVASVPTVDAAAVLARHWVSSLEWPLSPTHERIGCVCGKVWRGDAETGGCTARLLARENVALRERAEDLSALAQATAQECVRMRVAYGELNERTSAFTARVALLEGLLRETLSAFSEGEQWWRGHSGRCSEACPDDHRCCALYAEVLAALADGG